jgi:hypothetical protein
MILRVSERQGNESCPQGDEGEKHVMISREWLERYKTWNEARGIESLRKTGEKQLQDRWLEYNDLMSLCWKLKPERSALLQRLDTEEWEAYLEAVKTFEARRRK